MIPFYIKFILFFKKARIGIDLGEDGWTTKSVVKYFRGKGYVLLIERYVEPPLHYNCRSRPVFIDECSEITNEQREYLVKKFANKKPR